MKRVPSALVGIARAFAWMKMLDEGKVQSVPELCKLLDIDWHYLNRTLRLATLSPRIIRAIMTGNEPNGLSLEKIRKVSSDDWEVQERQLGFAS